MRKSIIFLFSIFLCLNVFAQSQICTLHSVLGDTIDKNEIEKYMLFSNYANDSIEYFVLSESSGLYLLNGYLDSLKVLNLQVSEEEVFLEKEKVEKLNNYFAAKSKRDTVNINIVELSDSISFKQINLNIQTPEFQKNLKKEKRRKYWQEKRRETNSNREKGMIY
jgi:hypothetical protein